AWLEGDTESWVENYDDATPKARRWGEREDRLLLSALLPKTGQSGSSGVMGPVEQFQTLHRSVLAVDGIIGPKTRKKLIEEYFKLSRSAGLGAESASASADTESKLATE